MNEKNDWVKALKISKKKLKEWQDEAPASCPLIVWALDRGHIDSELYLNWAVRNYGLPRLSDEYFTQPHVLQELQSYRESDDWTPWLFPVCVWEGTQFIACVEPPGDDLEQSEVRYVLAHPQAMARAWDIAEEDAATGINDLPPIPTAADINIEASITGTGFKLNVANQGMGIPKMPDVPDLPDLPQPPSIEDDSESTRTLLKSSVTASKPKIDQEVTETNFSEDIGDLSLTSIPDDLAAELNAATASAPLAPAKLQLPEFPDSSPSIFTSNSPSFESPGESTYTNVTATQTAAFSPKQHGNPAGDDVSSGAEQSDPPIAATPAPSQAGKSPFFGILAEVLEVHEHAIVFQYIKNKVVPYEWTSTTAVQSRQNASVSLDEPSLFRIVQKTKMPYHGFLVNSPEHVQFFSNINDGHLPKCATALPLNIGGKDFGILLAFSDKDLHAVGVLNTIEQGVAQLLPNVKIAS